MGISSFFGSTSGLEAQVRREMEQETAAFLHEAGLNTGLNTGLDPGLDPGPEAEQASPRPAAAPRASSAAKRPSALATLLGVREGSVSIVLDAAAAAETRARPSGAPGSSGSPGSPSPEALQRLAARLKKRLEALQGVRQVHIAVTAPSAPVSASRSSSGLAPGSPPGGPPGGPPPGGRRSPPTPPRPVAGVRHLVAVASGKGGVGKSTTTVNLALACAQAGARVGVLDLDIYGPSFPILLNLHQKPSVGSDKRLVPLEAYGLQTMSIGFLVPDTQAVIWRGPMVMGAVRQLLFDVAWSGLDVLFVDMPPGTGDAPLTLIQSAPLSGAVLVTTPQDLALSDARKALGMFQRLRVPILGLVQNMSHYACPACGELSHPFGQDGVRREADARQLSWLGAFPLERALFEGSENGHPLVDDQPDHPVSRLYREVGAIVLQKLETMGAASAGPSPGAEETEKTEGARRVVQAPGPSRSGHRPIVL